MKRAWRAISKTSQITKIRSCKEEIHPENYVAYQWCDNEVFLQFLHKVRFLKVSNWSQEVSLNLAKSSKLEIGKMRYGQIIIWHVNHVLMKFLYYSYTEKNFKGIKMIIWRSLWISNFLLSIVYSCLAFAKYVNEYVGCVIFTIHALKHKLMSIEKYMWFIFLIVKLLSEMCGRYIFIPTIRVPLAPSSSTTTSTIIVLSYVAMWCGNPQKQQISSILPSSL